MELLARPLLRIRYGRKSGSEGENDCCFTFLASHGCAKMTGIAGIEPVSFISCFFPELACSAVASHTLRLSSILNLRTSLLLEILISVSGAGRQPLMHFLGLSNPIAILYGGIGPFGSVASLGL